jgi:hypothetical protein
MRNLGNAGFPSAVTSSILALPAMKGHCLSLEYADIDDLLNVGNTAYIYTAPSQKTGSILNLILVWHVSFSTVWCTLHSMK